MAGSGVSGGNRSSGDGRPSGPEWPRPAPPRPAQATLTLGIPADDPSSGAHVC